MAIKVQETLLCSGRSVCRWLGLNRSTLRYTPKPVPDKTKLLEAEIVKMSKRYPCFGYRKITRKLVEEGWPVGKKLVQRVRCEEGLQVPAPKPRKRRQGLSTGLPQQAQHRNHVWAWDFVSDYTVRGGKLRVFNLIDEFTKECHCIHSDRAIKATDVLTVLQEAIEEHGAPEYIRSDNGPEFIATAIQEWLQGNGIKTIYIDPGCPWQNGYVESFNDKFRGECLNRELIYTLSESRVIFADYQHLHNYERPHRSLGLLTPKAYAKQLTSLSSSGRATPSLCQIGDQPQPLETTNNQPLGNLSL
jgi:putative transposase